MQSAAFSLPRVDPTRGVSGHSPDMGVTVIADFVSRGVERPGLAQLMGTAHAELDRRLLEADAALRVNGNTGPLAGYLTALREHIDLEEGALSAQFQAATRDPSPADPVTIMHREHRDLLQYATLIEQSLALTSDTAASELTTWLALLSATLAKHEFREETLVFPRWEAALSHRPDRVTFLDWLRDHLAEVLARTPRPPI